MNNILEYKDNIIKYNTKTVAFVEDAGDGVLDTNNFNNILNYTHTTVQLALEALDEISHTNLDGRSDLAQHPISSIDGNVIKAIVFTNDDLVGLGNDSNFTYDDTGKIMTIGTTNLKSGITYPTADSTTSLQFNKANGTTVIMNIDSTNIRVGINTNAPKETLHVSGGDIYMDNGYSITVENGSAVSSNLIGTTANVIDLGSANFTDLNVLNKIKLTNGILYPAVDATGAIKFNKADSTTNVLNIDTTNGRVSIGGHATPSATFQLHSAVGSNPVFKFSDADMTNPFSSYETDVNTVGTITVAGSTSGGLSINGYSSSASVAGLVFRGFIGSTTPTAAALTFRVAKLNNTTFQNIGNTEKAIEFSNVDGNLFYATILGNKNFGIDNVAPKSKLSVNGGIQIGTDADVASVDKIGTIRHSVVSDTSLFEVCKQIGVSSYAWQTINSMASSAVTVGNSSISGTTGDYLTLGAAVAAGATNILLIGSTLETGNITLTSSGIIVKGLNIVYNINLADYYLNGRSVSHPNKVIFENCKIVCASTTDKTIIDFQQGTCVCPNFYNVIVDDNSTSTHTLFYFYGNTTTPNGSFKNVRIELPNYASRFDVRNRLTLDNVVLVGGGSSCSTQSNYGTYIVNGLFLENTWSTSNAAILLDDASVICGIYSAVACIIRLHTDATLIRGNSISILIHNYDNIKLTNFHVKDISVVNTVGVYSKFSNGVIVNDSSILINDVVFESVRFLEAVTIANRMRLTDCDFVKGVTVNADDVDLLNCCVGVPGGATYKLTINAINDCTVQNLRTEVATTDNGTNTVNVNEKIW